MDALHFEYMPTLRQPYLLMTYGGWSDAAEVATAAWPFFSATPAGGTFCLD